MNFDGYFMHNVSYKALMNDLCYLNKTFKNKLMDERNDYNSIQMQRKTTALQNLINKFEEIKDLDYMVQVMILRGEAEKLLQQEREQIEKALP